MSFSVSVDLFQKIRRSEDSKLRQAEDAALVNSIDRYRNFMTLAIENPGEEFAPARDIDEVWHAHLTSPRAYLADCERLLGAGELVDHDAGFGATAEEAAELDAIFLRTATAFESRFHEPYITATCGGVARCIRACRVACKVKSAASGPTHSLSHG